MFNILAAKDSADMRELFCTVLASHGLAKKRSFLLCSTKLFWRFLRFTY